MEIININGNTHSIKQSILDEIASIYDIEISKQDFLDEQLVGILAVVTQKINREIAVFINRKGHIVDISIGDNSSVSIPNFEGRRNENRLCGIRCIHTHPNGNGQLSIIDINSLINLKLDAMVAIGVKEGEIDTIYCGIPILDSNDGIVKPSIYGPYNIDDKKLNTLNNLIYETDKNSKSIKHINEGDRKVK